MRFAATFLSAHALTHCRTADKQGTHVCSWCMWRVQRARDGGGVLRMQHRCAALSTDLPALQGPQAGCTAPSGKPQGRLGKWQCPALLCAPRTRPRSQVCLPD